MFENEVLSIASMLLTFIGILFAYRFFGRAGLFAWMGMAILIANIEVTKTISVFGFVTAMGNVIYATTFLVTDILTENHGKQEARKAVLIGFFVMVMFTMLMQLTLLFTAHESDTLSPALSQIFGILPRIAIASVCAYLISQLLDIWIFERIGAATNGRMLWLRNNVATFIGQFLDNAVFTWIAFVGFGGLFGWEQVFEWPIIFSIFFTSLAIKYAVALCDTPFLYAAVWMKKKGLINE